MITVNKNMYLKSYTPNENPYYRYWTFIHKLNPRIIKIVKEQYVEDKQVITGDKECIDFLKENNVLTTSNKDYWTLDKAKQFSYNVEQGQTNSIISKRGTNKGKGDE